MKNTIIYSILWLSLTSFVRAQSMFYVSTDVESDSLYSQSELKKENIKSIKCTEYFFNLDIKLTPDTISIVRYFLDSLYRVTTSTKILSGWQTRRDTSVFRCQYHYHGKMIVKNCSRKTEAYTEVVRNGILLSYKTYRPNISKKLSLFRYDTLIYSGKQLCGKQTILFSTNLNALSDTIRHDYLYDSLGRITIHSINPPKFFRTLSKSHSGYDYDKVIYDYSYYNDIIRARHFIITNSFKDTLLDAEEFISKHTVSKNFYYEDFKSLRPDTRIWYNFAVKTEDQKYSLEGTLRDLQYRINRDNSSLPSYITILRGQWIYIYSFDYETR